MYIIYVYMHGMYVLYVSYVCMYVCMYMCMYSMIVHSSATVSKVTYLEPKNLEIGIRIPV